MTGFVYVNGQIVRREAATVSAFDRSFLYGDGLFETVRAYRGTPFMLMEHLERMSDSASELGMRMPEPDEIAGVVAELIKRNKLTEAYVRITLSRGIHTGALAPDQSPKPGLVVEARQLHPYPREMYERGAKAIVSSLRHDSSSPVRRHKTTSYLTSVLAKREAKKCGADEAVLLDHAGDVAEGATSNVFCVRDGRLFTPPPEMNILPGITRRSVIKLARRNDLEVIEVRFGLADLRSADEVFLTNSLMEVMPVRSIDGEEVSSSPGPTAGLLAEAYTRFVGGQQAGCDGRSG